jgi:hypothetical protein
VDPLARVHEVQLHAVALQVAFRKAHFETGFSLDRCKV